MNICAKIITVIGLLALSVSVFAAPIAPEQEPTPITLSLSDVCSIMGMNGITFAELYKEGKTRKEIAEFLEQRNNERPEMVFAMPGVLQILYLIERFKVDSPELYNEPNFPTAMGIVAHDMCMDDGANGWIQDVPGKAKILKQKPPGIAI